MKSYRVWLTAFALIISILNVTLGDDYNVLIYFTSPHLVLLSQFNSFIEILGQGQDLKMNLLIINIAGWFFIGWLIDLVVRMIKKRTTGSKM